MPCRDQQKCYTQIAYYQEIQILSWSNKFKYVLWNSFWYFFLENQLVYCQGFIQALLLTSVFHKGLSFMAVGNNPTYVVPCSWGLKLPGFQIAQSFPFLVDLIFSIFRSLFSFCTDFLCH